MRKKIYNNFLYCHKSIIINRLIDFDLINIVKHIYFAKLGNVPS